MCVIKHSVPTYDAKFKPMNMLSIPCPNCSTRLKVPAVAAGKRLRCLSCGTLFHLNATPSASSATQRRSSPLLLLATLVLGTIGAGVTICLLAFSLPYSFLVPGNRGDKDHDTRTLTATSQSVTGVGDPDLGITDSTGATTPLKQTPSTPPPVQQAASTQPANTPLPMSAKAQSASPTTPSPYAESPRSGQTEIVIAEGVGIDTESARKDACRNAVRQAVGSYVDSETLVANDELITDRVVVLSPAFVEKLEPIVGTERNDNGLIRVRVRAHVKLTKLLDELAAGKIRTRALPRKIDTESLVAELTTKSDQHHARETVLGKLFSDYPESCLVVTQTEKESLEKSPDGLTYLKIPLSITPNEQAYQAFSKVLCESLSVTERVSGEFQVDGERSSINPADTNEKRNRLSGVAVKDLIREVFDGPFYTALSQSLDGQGRSSFVDVGPVYLFETGAIDNAYNRTFGMWGELRGAPDTDRYVACVTSAQKNFRRLSWRWFRVTAKEYEAWFSKVPNRIASRTQLLGGDGAVLADDKITLCNLGVCRGSRENGLWCVPGFAQHNMHWYTPELRFVRLVEVDDEDVPKISGIKVTLERHPATR